MKKLKNWIQSIGIIAGLLIIVALLLALPHVFKIHKDFELIKLKEHDTLLLSMFSIENYDENDFAHYRGMTALKAGYNVPNGKLMRWYFDKVREYNTSLERVYLGVDPEHTSKEDIVILIQQNPDVYFEVFLPYPQIDYWAGMEEKKFEKIMQQYKVFTEWIIPLENACIYVFGNEDWLVGNSLNYTDTFTTNEEISEFLMCNMDAGHSYQASFESMEQEMLQYYELYAEYQNRNKIDLSGTEIIFFGDSIIGNYTDTLSIPKVVEGECGAKTYNLGQGGGTATWVEDNMTNFCVVVDAFLAGEANMLPEESQCYKGLKSYLEEGAKDAPKIFVINFGLNDYFNALPLKAEEVNDISTYEGALRTTVSKLQKAYPDAEIILMTPHFTYEFHFGKDILGEKAGSLEDYANIVIEIARELNVGVLDNFREVGINEANWKQYQPDGTHPNEKGRFAIGRELAKYIMNNR